MSNLLKVAKKMELKLKRFADAGVFSQLGDITSFAMSLYKMKDSFVQAVLDSSGGGQSIYADGKGQQTAKQVSDLLLSAYQNSFALLNDAKNLGMDATGMRDRKNQLLSYCHILKSIPGVSQFDAANNQTLASFELAVNSLEPTDVQMKPKAPQTTNSPTPGGVAHFRDEESEEEANMTSEDPSENMSRLY